MRSVIRRSGVVALLGAIGVFAAAPGLAKQAQSPGRLEAVVQEQLATDHDAAKSQQRVDDLDDQTRALLKHYEQLTSEAKSMDAYSDLLDVQVKSQRDEIASTQKELDGVEQTAQQVLPMMQQMVDTLDRFVSLDIPFLQDERTQRVQRLKDMMKRADVSIAEKYRRIAEAYQIEMDYGRTLESYQGQLASADGPPRTVRFLRIGRVALLYQTLDGRETGYWDVNKRTWVADNDYRQDAKKGFAVALKQGAPELLIAPVPAPQEAGS
jgi:Protein of unknown function (DUF3450)